MMSMRCNVDYEQGVSYLRYITDEAYDQRRAAPCSTLLIKHVHPLEMDNMFLSGRLKMADCSAGPSSRNLSMVPPPPTREGCRGKDRSRRRPWYEQERGPVEDSAWSRTEG
ncbi:uncharacterized protein PV06_04861 [Exophiala oligosperma]|uniref:Uncharacterized protein n=1 Tax=Exophiala oligosperma TaxID=215243 RepID=A0A0D2AVG3_9EURO|nr:uncharacterized protein PV06_04861 [Exophiala oligosperma]KIW43796.1 hypothetical protein PV06_04861 [Exophiala oligosperma]